MSGLPIPAPAPAPKIAYLGYCGLIDSAGVTKITQMLNSVVNDASYGSVHLCITSNGGYVGDGVYLYNHIRALPKPVTMHNTGTVASIATTLFAAAERRICSPNAVFMMHPIHVPGAGAMATTPLEAALQAALADEQRTEQILRDRTSIPDDMLIARRRSDVYLTADQALKFALVHEIADFTLPAGAQIFQI
jgi:ATP-dependent Clp protease protease subunit